MQRFALQEVVIAEYSVGDSEGKQQRDEGIEVESFGKLPVQQSGKCTSASATGAFEMKVFVDGALRVEAELRGRKEKQNGCGDSDGSQGGSCTRDRCDVDAEDGRHRVKFR
jgi:collagenase-like PrtC family protease